MKVNKEETWRDVVGFEGFYEVSDKGNVYSVERKDSRGRRCGRRILKPRCDEKGYLQVNLYKNGILKRKRTHRLVAEAFIPNANGFSQVNHRDEVKNNNNVENLEWCDSKYNNNYGTRTERLSKKVRAVNVETGEVLTFNSTKEAGRKGYDQSGVAKACKGVFYTNGHLYKGYEWWYE